MLYYQGRHLTLILILFFSSSKVFAWDVFFFSLPFQLPPSTYLSVDLNPTMELLKGETETQRSGLVSVFSIGSEGLSPLRFGGRVFYSQDQEKSAGSDVDVKSTILAIGGTVGIDFASWLKLDLTYYVEPEKTIGTTKSQTYDGGLGQEGKILFPYGGKHFRIAPSLSYRQFSYSSLKQEDSETELAEDRIERFLTPGLEFLYYF